MLFSRRPFITWLTTNALVATGLFWAWETGVIQAIVGTDHTKLTVVAFLVFLAVSFHIGATAKRVERYERQWEGFDTEYEVLKNKVSVGWFFGQICLTIGLIGSLIGFIGMMLVAFGDTAIIQDSTAISGLLPTIGKNYGTALYVTLIGVMAGAIMQVQTFAVDYALDMKYHDA